MSRPVITDENGDGHFGFGELLKPDTVDALISQHNEHAEALDTLENTPAVNGWDKAYYEWNDDWMQGTATFSFSGGWNGLAIGSPPYSIQLYGSDAALTTISGTGRLGIVALSTGTNGAGAAAIATNSTSVILDEGMWIFEATIALPNLSSSGEGYSLLIGFAESHLALDQDHGAYLLYDERNAATSGPNSGNAHKWSLWACNGGTRSTTLTSQTVGAVTYPSTNLYRVKVEAGGNLVRGYVNSVLVGELTTNVPTGLANACGAGIGIVKNAGTTARRVDIDQTRLTASLDSTRTPQ